MLARVTIALLLRQGIVQATMVLCGVVLARALDPARFGVYVLCTFLASLLTVVGDLGLGAYLVREGAVPDERAWRTAFTVRQICDVMVVTLFFVAVPVIARWYSLPPEDVTAIRALALILPISALSLVSVVRCERGMRFITVAVIESLQSICYAAVVLTHTDRGAAGFVTGWLAHALCGAVLYQLAAGWRPAWALDHTMLRKALPFSLPYQAAGAVHIARDGAIPLLVGALLGAAAVGTANWAQMLGLSIVIGAYVVQRGLLPSFSRIIQRDPAELTHAAETALFCLSGAILTLMFAIAINAQDIARLIFGPQWIAALPYFYAIAALNLLLPAVIVGGSVLSAFGRSDVVFRTMAASVGTLWTLGAITVPQLGLWGYVVALLLSQLVLAWIVIETKRAIAWRVFRATAGTVAWLFMLAIAMHLAAVDGSANVTQLLARILGYVVVGALGVFWMLRRRQTSVG